MKINLTDAKKLLSLIRDIFSPLNIAKSAVQNIFQFRFTIYIKVLKNLFYLLIDLRLIDFSNIGLDNLK